VDEDKTITLDLGGEAPTAEASDASDAVGSSPGWPPAAIRSGQGPVGARARPPGSDRRPRETDQWRFDL